MNKIKKAIRINRTLPQRFTARAKKFFTLFLPFVLLCLLTQRYCLRRFGVAVRAENAASEGVDGAFDSPDDMVSEDIAVKIDGDVSEYEENAWAKSVLFVFAAAAGGAGAFLSLFICVKKKKEKKREAMQLKMKKLIEKVEIFIAKDPVFYADIADMVRYGTCRFVYAGEDGVLFQENGGFYKHGTFVFAAESEKAARKILLLCPEEYENIRNGLLACHGEKIAAFCRDFFDFDRITPCYQTVYRPESPLPLQGVLRFEPASEKYLPKIIETYDRESPQALRKLMRQGKIYCAFAAAPGDTEEKEVFAGYIGQHPEGSMGLLYIFPEFRRRGYAQEAESFQINAILAEGRTPYAHIIEDNYKSYALQKKLGAVFAEDKVVWMSRSFKNRE